MVGLKEHEKALRLISTNWGKEDFASADCLSCTIMHQHGALEHLFFNLDKKKNNLWKCL